VGVLGADAVTFTSVFRTRRYPLGSTVRVDRFADRPPRLGLRGGRLAVFVIAPAVWSGRTSARDEAVRAINSRLEGSGG